MLLQSEFRVDMRLLHLTQFVALRDELIQRFDASQTKQRYPMEATSVAFANFPALVFDGKQSEAGQMVYTGVQALVDASQTHPDPPKNLPFRQFRGPELVLEPLRNVFQTNLQNDAATIWLVMAGACALHGGCTYEVNFCTCILPEPNPITCS